MIERRNRPLRWSATPKKAWVELGIEKGRLDERRRIIKMLEKYDEPIWADDFIDKIERGSEEGQGR